MRWILPLLSVALAHSALGELAVYSGLLVVDNVATARPNTVRVANVIDLATGKMVIVAISGTTTLEYTVGPEVEYVIAKTTGARGRGVTAFARASTQTDAAGSQLAISSNLRGQDARVTLGTTGASQWPRTLSGVGSFVASVGTNATTAPAGAAFSRMVLTLNEPWSKAANAAGGTLAESAESIAPLFLDRVAAMFKITRPWATGAGGGPITGIGGVVEYRLIRRPEAGLILTGGVTITGAGTLTLGGGNTFAGGTIINGGTLQLNPGGSTVQVAPIGSTIQLNPIGGQISGGTLTISNPNTNVSGIVTGSAALLNTGASTLTGSSNFSSGTTLTASPISGAATLLGASTLPAYLLNGGSIIVPSSTSLSSLIAAFPNLTFHTVNNGATTTVTATAAPASTVPAQTTTTDSGSSNGAGTTDSVSTENQ